VDPAIDTVIAVTLAQNFKNFSGTMEEYVDGHRAGTHTDPIINFHTSYGANVVDCVPGFRPEDADNQGIGVLIQYHVKNLVAAELQPAPTDEAASKVSKMPTTELLADIMVEQGYPPDINDLDRGFLQCWNGFPPDDGHQGQA